ncbi:uncharacterized protein LOC120349492 [Nilaparvata lugens]|uniref:uncharacterized protein LOC120349492 n=2 Tax=Nilaparvata lugens TaxID=108931 RepID=UPI00193D6B63|nr:uncharacterized protein LOC120349492 [Nilaparvata lugens]
MLPKRFPVVMENYDPYKSAERQMKELLGLSDDDDALVHSLVPQPPSSSTAPVLNSFNSAFAKFAPIQSPSHNSNRSPDSDLDNDFERLEAESRVTPTLADRCDGIVDKNFNPMSLSTISLCSTISIESFDNSRNNLRKGISSSAKVPSCDRKAQLPLQRSVSVVETPRRGRDFLKSNLKMEHLLFGVTGSNHYNNNNFNDNCDVSDDSSSDNKTLRSSNDLLKNSNSSLADTSPAEQELLKSVSEFEKLFAMPSTLNPYSPLIPNSSLSNTLTPLDHIDKHRSQANKFITDSAYNSMNRKSPQQSSPVEMDTCWSGGSSECSSTRGGAVAAAVVGVGASQTANFCHECGSKFPVLAAKFCCNCGVRRLVI